MGGIDQEKIYARAICSGPCRGINRIDFKPRAQNLSRAVDIPHIDFYLLNSFPEFFKILSNCTAATRCIRCEDIECEGSLKVQLEFNRILLWRNIGERLHSTRCTNLLKCFRQNGKPNSNFCAVARGRV